LLVLPATWQGSDPAEKLKNPGMLCFQYFIDLHWATPFPVKPFPVPAHLP
jgi:hypothetical protein